MGRPKKKRKSSQGNNGDAVVTILDRPPSVTSLSVEDLTRVSKFAATYIDDQEMVPGDGASGSFEAASLSSAKVLIVTTFFLFVVYFFKLICLTSVIYFLCDKNLLYFIVSPFFSFHFDKMFSFSHQIDPSSGGGVETAETAKDTLFQWCKRMTEGYPGVRVRDFSNSFRDAQAFLAIIHRIR